MRIFIGFLMMTLLYSAPVLADDATTPLAQVIVPVPDRTDVALNQGLQTAFEQQMIEQSGDLDIMSAPDIQAAEKNVSQWVETYGYVEQENANPQQPPTLMLQVTFDRAALVKLLRHSQVGSDAQSLESQSAVMNQNTVHVTITGIQDMTDLSSAQNALRQVGGVRQVSTDDIQADRATMSVAFLGDAFSFESEMTGNNRFKAAEAPLEYKWVGRES